MKARVIWKGGLGFSGIPASGHAVTMDGPLSAGGSDSAARPMELLLLALGGCTGMDVINILRKQRRKVTSFYIDLAAEQAEEYPRVFTKVAMTYRIGGEGLDEESVRRAIELSDAKYCSVAATLRLPVVVDWAMEILES